MAKRFVDNALYYSKDIVIGTGMQGPFDHFFGLNKDPQSSRCSIFNPDDLFLYAVTDSRMNKKWNRSIVDAVKAAIEGGATIIQLRFDHVCYNWSFNSFYFSLMEAQMTSQCFPGRKKLKHGSFSKKQNHVLAYADPTEFVC